MRSVVYDCSDRRHSHSHACKFVTAQVLQQQIVVRLNNFTSSDFFLHCVVCPKNNRTHKNLNKTVNFSFS